MTGSGRIAGRAGVGLVAITMAAGLLATPAVADKSTGNDGKAAQGNAYGHDKQEAREQQQAQPAPAPAPEQHAAPGQERRAETPAGPKAAKPAPAKPAHPANPAHAAKPAQPAKPAHPAHPVYGPPKPKPAHPVHPAHPVAPAHAAPVNTHAKAGKTTICHSTGSATNPFVTITISNNALPAHARHHDGRDIIPAPAGGCPAAASSRTAEQAAIDAAPARAQGEVQGEQARSAAPAAAPAPTVAVLGVVASGGEASLAPLSDTIAEAKKATVRRESAARPVAVMAAAAPRSDAGRLPFTGLETVLVGLAGLMLVLVGVLVRRLSGDEGLVA
jgi:hypothetical protein